MFKTWIRILIEIKWILSTTAAGIHGYKETYNINSVQSSLRSGSTFVDHLNGI